MIRFTIKDAADACGGVLNTTAGEDAFLGRIIIDSRQVQPGDLFVAYRGEKTDGHRFIPKAFESGAACCLAEYVPEGVTGPVITVPDVQQALEQIGAALRTNISCPVVGITGSVGKTTAKEMVSGVLAQAMPVLRTEGNLNNHIGVPMTLSRVTEEHGAAVVEMGISGFGEMTRLAKMARPDIALYTVIGHAHLEFLHDLDGVLQAKTEMLDQMAPDAVVIFNGDDEKQRSKQCRQHKVYYGLGDNCDVCAENITADGLSQRCDIVYKDRRIPVSIPAFGRHMIYAALEGAAVGFVMGLSDEQIRDGIAAFHVLGRRGARTETGYLTVIDDSYNGNTDSIESSIDSLSSLPGRHVCVLGDMLELGENSPALHREVGAYALQHGVAQILCVGPWSVHTVEGAGEIAVHFETVDALIAALPDYVQRGDTVLVQASHGMHLDAAAEALKQLKDPDAPFILLDLDDTILDFHKAEAIAVSRTFETMGLEPTPELVARYSAINAQHWERLERGELTREEVLVGRFDTLFREIGSDLSGLEARMRYEKNLEIGHYFIPGAEELLEQLSKSGCRLFIISNGTAAVQDSRIASAGIAKYFERIFISERVGANKPSVEFYEKTLTTIPGFHKNRALIIGDSLTSDILGGLNTGIRTCRFNPQHKPGRADIVPDHEIESLSELPGLIEQLFGWPVA